LRRSLGSSGLCHGTPFAFRVWAETKTATLQLFAAVAAVFSFTLGAIPALNIVPSVARFQEHYKPKSTTNRE
jgi:hypothetical protein